MKVDKGVRYRVVLMTDIDFDNPKSNMVEKYKKDLGGIGFTDIKIGQATPTGKIPNNPNDYVQRIGEMTWGKESGELPSIEEMAHSDFVILGMAPISPPTGFMGVSNENWIYGGLGVAGAALIYKALTK